MNSLNNLQKDHNSWQKPVSKLAITDFNHSSFNQVQCLPAKEDIVPIKANMTASNSELVIATEPEVIVIIGYAEFGNNLEIYGTASGIIV